MAGYNPYNSFYMMQDLQNMKDRIDRTMQQYQQNQMQSQQPMQPITQNFQITPNNPSNNELESKYASNIDEVKNTFVIKTGLFATKDFSTIWVKDVTGNIRTYKTEEIIELDEKDKKIREQDNTILALQRQINELKGIQNNQDPGPILQQIFINKPELKQKTLGEGKKLGVPNNILSQIQNLGNN